MKKIYNSLKSLFKKENNSTGPAFILNSDRELNDTFLFDFKNYQSQYTGATMNTFISVGGADSDSSEDQISSTSQKIAVKPKDVLEELETIPTPWTLSISMTRLRF